METSKSENTLKFDYHKKIKELREKKNYKQEHLAEVLHISQRAYSSIENGQTQLTLERLFEIARVLEVPFYEIIGLEPQNIYHNNFNNNALHNKGTTHYQCNFEEHKNLYERLLQAKDDENKGLKERIEQCERLLQAKDDEIKRLREKLGEK